MNVPYKPGANTGKSNIKPLQTQNMEPYTKNINLATFSLQN